MVYRGALQAPWPCEPDGRSTVPDQDRAQVDRVSQALRYSSSHRPRPATSSRPCARAYHHETPTSSTRPHSTASQTLQAPGSQQATAKRRTHTSAHQTSASSRKSLSHRHGTRVPETRRRHRHHSASHLRHSHQTHRPPRSEPQTLSRSQVSRSQHQPNPRRHQKPSRPRPDKSSRRDKT